MCWSCKFSDLVLEPVSLLAVVTKNQNTKNKKLSDRKPVNKHKLQTLTPTYAVPLHLTQLMLKQ